MMAYSANALLQRLWASSVTHWLLTSSLVLDKMLLLPKSYLTQWSNLNELVIFLHCVSGKKKKVEEVWGEEQFCIPTVLKPRAGSQHGLKKIQWGTTTWLLQGRLSALKGKQSIRHKLQFQWCFFEAAINIVFWERMQVVIFRHLSSLVQFSNNPKRGERKRKCVV